MGENAQELIQDVAQKYSKIADYPLIVLKGITQEEIKKCKSQEEIIEKLSLISPELNNIFYDEDNDYNTFIVDPCVYISARYELLNSIIGPSLKNYLLTIPQDKILTVNDEITFGLIPYSAVNL